MRPARCDELVCPSAWHVHILIYTFRRGKGERELYPSPAINGQREETGEKGRCGCREPELAMVEYVLTGGELGAVIDIWNSGGWYSRESAYLCFLYLI